jgi:hypothetical protein
MFKMPVNSTLVTRFFQLIIYRQFSEAERELERIKKKMHKTDWNQGYFKALSGMLLGKRSSTDSYSFISKLDLTDKKILKIYKKEFSSHVKNKLHENYDRGYFSAWSDFSSMLIKMEVENNYLDNKPKLITLKSDDKQAIMKNFLT